jgi:hypothetical protein
MTLALDRGFKENIHATAYPGRYVDLRKCDNENVPPQNDSGTDERR